MREFAYGGQAVIEGVGIRGRSTIALAVRRPSGSIYRYREHLDSPLQRSRTARLPLVRGIIVLWESLVVGVRMLMRSANVALEGEAVKIEGGSAVGFLGGKPLIAPGSCLARASPSTQAKP